MVLRILLENFNSDTQEAKLDRIINLKFTNGDEFPILQKQRFDFVRPFQMICFSDRNKASLIDSVCFYEWDKKFENQLKEEKIHKIIPSLKLAGSVVQPDYSIFADEPLILQKMAVFEKNRVAAELQSAGIEVIPNLRWGDKRSYDFAFLGIPKNQICAIGTYGQIHDVEKRELFESGLEIALESVRPREVLVYGSMPNDIFGPYKNIIKFTRYPSWQEYFSKTGKAC